MNKRYQVFVSSTFNDLENERRAVFHSLMMMRFIVAGMEWFPAATEAQWKVVTRAIDDSDFYVLIIGGRYGSTTSEGLSFTEKEFDYAVEKRLPILVFCHKNPNLLPLEKSEIDQNLRHRLEAFRKKATTDRMVRFWSNNPEELANQVTIAVITAMDTTETVGWIRANKVTAKQVLGDDSEKIKIGGTYWRGETQFTWWIAAKWSHLLEIVSPCLALKPQREHQVRHLLLKSLTESLEGRYGQMSRATLNDADFENLKHRLSGMNLIFARPETSGGPEESVWSLTAQGEELLSQRQMFRGARIGTKNWD